MELRNNSSIRNKDETRQENNKTKITKEIDKKEIVHEILQGVLAGLAVCTKQSVGFFYCYCYSDFSSNSKVNIKKMGLRISGMGNT